MPASPILLLLLLVAGGNAQAPKPAPQAPVTSWHGTFTASAGRLAQFRGRWSGQAETANSASGSWILLNDEHKIVAEGTWRAQKSPSGWRGAWHAWVKGGRQYAGQWEAELEGFRGKTFEDMLSHTLEQQVSGSWQSGKLAGNWSLRGTKW